MRAARYGVTGVPDVRVDGTRAFVGAGTCEEQVALYRDAFQDALRGEDWLSPVEITGSLDIVGNTATVSATLELLDPGTFDAHQVTVFLIEDQVAWCCGYNGQDVWDGVVRMVRSTPASLTTVGQTVFVSESIEISTMDAQQLHPVVVYEEIGGSRRVVQASDLAPLPYAFAASFPTLVGSTPGGSTSVEWNGELFNFGELADTFEITADAGFGWPVEITAEGGTGSPEFQTVTIAPGSSVDLFVRVQASGPARVGRGTISVRSQHLTQTQEIEATVFHGSPSLRLVTDAGPGSSHVRFETALGELEQPYDSWFTRTDGPPGAGLLRGYDVVVWQTGLLTGNLMSDREETVLRDYLANGGGLFVSSMGLVGSRMPGDPFLADQLGAVDWTNDAGAVEGNGIPGDPITDGLALTFEWSSPDRNDVDVLVPSAEGAATMENETGMTIGVRAEPASGGRSVFLPVFLDAIPEGASPPNDFPTLLGRITSWLVGTDVSGVPTSETTRAPSLLLASPSPFRGSVRILGDARSVDRYDRGAGASLEVFDPAGRSVRTLESTEAGAWTWDGKDSGGRDVAPGVYFARTVGGSQAGATVRLIRVE
ncbi:MAG: hypothetical protein R3E97_11425 [Candidatus Eisenbacteria bacterium]